MCSNDGMSRLFTTLRPEVIPSRISRSSKRSLRFGRVSGRVERLTGVCPTDIGSHAPEPPSFAHLDRFRSIAVSSKWVCAGCVVRNRIGQLSAVGGFIGREHVAMRQLVERAFGNPMAADNQAIA